MGWEKIHIGKGMKKEKRGVKVSLDTILSYAGKRSPTERVRLRCYSGYRMVRRLTIRKMFLRNQQSRDSETDE